MKNRIYFKTDSDNKYYFSEENKTISLDKTNIFTNKNNNIISNTKEQKASKHNREIKFETRYSPNSIKSNLANLRMLLIEVTDKCNLMCKYCGYGELYGNYDRRESRIQDFKSIKSLIDYLYILWKSPLNISYNNNITIGFYGGEPLIGIEIIKKTISYIESLNIDFLNFSYNMTTNAILLDKHMDFLVKKDFKLLISIDGNRYNNSYRLTKNKKPSFDSIINNISMIREKYPDFFQKNVSFNSVLHNRNSVKEIQDFITSKFGKQPSISELNATGILAKKKEDFLLMFKNKFENIRDEENCSNDVQNDYFSTDPLISNLDRFIRIYTSNTYNDYPDLFIDESNQSYIPTGTCEPFKRKLFITVNGKILPCEKIGHERMLGCIENGIVKINYSYISELYSSLYNSLLKKCKNCSMYNNCTLCVFHIPVINGELKCNRYYPYSKIEEYFKYYMSHIEKHPEYYDRILNELTNY